MLGMSCTGMVALCVCCVRLTCSGGAEAATKLLGYITSGITSCALMQKMQKFSHKRGSVLCDWTFTFHVPECFKKSSFLPYFTIEYKACIFSE